VILDDSHGEASMKNLLFQVPEDTTGFRTNEGDPGTHPSFPCAHHLLGLQIVVGH